MIPNPVLREERAALHGIEKAPTGIAGLDEITYGGLPKARTTLLCGAAGCGKTLFAMTFLHHGAVEFQEPGVFVAFEERPPDLITNFGSLHYDVQKLIADKKLAIDHIQIDRNDIEEAGDYDLEALFIRLGFAIASIGAKLVVIATIEALFGAFEIFSKVPANSEILSLSLHDALLISRPGPGR